MENSRSLPRPTYTKDMNINVDFDLTNTLDPIPFDSSKKIVIGCGPTHALAIGKIYLSCLLK